LRLLKFKITSLLILIMSTLLCFIISVVKIEFNWLLPRSIYIWICVILINWWRRLQGCFDSGHFRLILNTYWAFVGVQSYLLSLLVYFCVLCLHQLFYGGVSFHVTLVLPTLSWPLASAIRLAISSSQSDVSSAFIAFILCWGQSLFILP